MICSYSALEINWSKLKCDVKYKIYTVFQKDFVQKSH